MKQIIRNNKGFTLVEMAIVLVIIGLLLGGVLKGQELIENSKSKKAVNDLNAISVAYNGYVDRYGRIPGDDGPVATLQARGGNWANITVAGNRNGILAITPAQTFATGGESVAFWQAVKASGFIAGNPADTGVAALPTNAYQGLIGVANNTTGITGMVQGLSVCISQVPGKAAAQLDSQLDDRNPATGSVRATIGAAGLNTAPGAAPAPSATATYSEDNQYTVCRAL
ncbi:MAG: prepilin-type N-terminal cleavage/methylation domain-containing protein [Desulfuromonadaceae bacterium]|nr:prepilin-type N-terminal cleavage/methylation domain-containing protein [Desulfuromonadaceae bacterium]MDD2848798.1 prepilin-type N-terminal cleavage/methylation domain-containing protein [Desulfuromonadaceae bacterium]MDD4130448.1 prepilin-type N-terminal cleavage/methylation domain-containing protein [Desulfuromonadaceae bacterium]